MGNFLALWGQKVGYFEGWVQVQIVLGSTHIVQQSLFSLFPSILTFDFDLILGLSRLFGALLSYFLVQCGAQKLFWGPLM